MRLWSGAPLWLLRGGLDEPLPVPLRDCDVAIVGAGLTGALLADSLVAAGFSVVVLDRRVPCEGSTAACTGILTYEVDLELVDLAERIGEDRAVRSYRACVEGVRMLGALTRTLPDDCGFAWRQSLYLGRRRRDAKRLQREADMRARCDLDTEYLSSRDVASTYGFSSHGALRTHTSAVLDPIRLTQALLARAVRGGATLGAGIAVLRWRDTGDAAEIETSRGTLRANRIVFATGYEAPPQFRDDLVALHSSYALATFPVERPESWADQCTIWDTSRPYLYLRAAENNRIVIGGLDVPFRDAAWRDRLIPRKTQALERQLKTLFPALRTETEFVWAGTFGETRDGLPYIGPTAGAPRAMFALGYGGNGIVFSALASQMLRDALLGEGHEYFELFGFER